jgi:hypothetical protein
VPVPNVVKGADDFAAGKTDFFLFALGAGKVRETDAKVGGIRVIGIDSCTAREKVCCHARWATIKP